MEKELWVERIKVEKKTFTFELKENPKGRFLRVIEDVGGRRDTVIIPVSGLEMFKDVLERAIHVNSKLK